MPNRQLFSRMPQLPVESGRLLLWEQTRSWGRFFLSRLQQTEPSKITDISLVVEQAIFVDSARELDDAVEKHPASFVIAEATLPHIRELLVRLPFLRQGRPLLRMIITCFELPQRPIDEYEIIGAIFREAGALAVLATQRELQAMTPAVATHFTEIPQRKTNWQDEIERRLPWRNATQ